MFTVGSPWRQTVHPLCCRMASTSTRLVLMSQLFSPLPTSAIVLASQLVACPCDVVKITPVPPNFNGMLGDHGMRPSTESYCSSAIMKDIATRLNWLVGRKSCSGRGLGRTPRPARTMLSPPRSQRPKSLINPSPQKNQTGACAHVSSHFNSVSISGGECGVRSSMSMRLWNEVRVRDPTGATC